MIMLSRNPAGKGATLMDDNSSRKMKSEAGLSLIELLVALIILAAGIVPILISLGSMKLKVVESGAFSEAVRFAGEKVDSLRFSGFAALESSYLGGGTQVSGTVENDTEIVKGKYYRTTTVRYMKQNGDGSLSPAAAADIPTNFIKLESVVRWAIKGVDRSDTVSSVLARTGSQI